MAGEINRSINIYLNEADVEASLTKLGKSAEVLTGKMEKAAGDPAKLKELQAAYDATTGKINTLNKQLSGELAPSMRQMEQNAQKIKNELRNMSVGTDEYVAKSKKLQEAEMHLKKVKEEAYGVGKAIDSTAKGAGVFSNIKDKAKDLAGSLPGIGSAASALMGPFGLLLGVATALISIIKQNAEVADKWEFAMGGIHKTTRLWADLMVEKIKPALEWFSKGMGDPIQALKDLGNAIQENLINRFKAFGVFLEAIKLALAGDWTAAAKKALDATSQFGSGIENVTDKYGNFINKSKEAYEEGYKSAEMLDALITQQKDLEYAIALTNITIEKQTTLMKDTTKSDEERLAAANKVVELETLNANRKLKAIDLEMKAIKERNKGIVLSGEELGAYRELEIKKLEAISAKEAAISKATINRNKLEVDLAAKAMKNSMIIEGIEPVKEAALSGTSTVGDFVKKTAGTVVEGIKTFASYGSMQFEKFKEQWMGVVQAGAAGASEVINGITGAFTAAGDRELAHEKKNNEAKKKNLDNLLSHKKISQADYNKKMAVLDAEYAEKQRAQKKKAFVAEKAAKIVSTIISVAAGIAAQFQAGPAGIALAAIAGALGAAQIAFIAAQPVPEFAKGGVARGARHSSGGISMINADGTKVGEMEGDEPYMILSRDTYRNNGRIIDALLDTSMNRGGARLDLSALPQQPRFNFGGVFENIKRAHFASGGVFNGQAGDSSAQTAIMNSLLDRLNQPIIAEVVYQDITDKGQALNRASSRASFSKS
jgi:hypothetical protein